jgi:hypothetical protein
MKAAFLSSATVLLLLFLCAESAPQQASDKPATQPSKVVLREGTDVLLKLAQDVNSRTAKQDDPVEFSLSKPVKAGDIVVAEVGSRAIGTVVHTMKPNFVGEPGELSVRLKFLKAGNVKVPLRGSTAQAGTFRIVIRGSQAVIRQGTLVKAYVDSDTEIETESPASPSSSLLPSEQTADAKPANTIRLPNGKPLRLLLIDSLSSKTAKVGDRIKLQVLEDVKIGGLIVIAKKAPASGTITETHPAGRAWHKGELAIRLDTVTLANHQTLALEFATNKAGDPTNATAAWAQSIVQTEGLALFALPFAPLQHGNQATMRRGTVMEAVTQGEVLLDRANIEAAQPKMSVAKTGPASVTIYFPNFEETHFHEIWCGAVQLVDLKRGRNITVQLPAGKYYFRLHKKSPASEFDLEDGVEYYVRVGFLQPSVSPAGSISGLTMVTQDIGEVESIDTRTVESKSIPDLSKMDLAILQAERPK